MGGERVDAGTVFKAVEQLKNRFDVQRSAVERAMKSQVWMVDRQMFEQYTELYLESMGLNLSENYKKVEVPTEISEAMGVDMGKLNSEKEARLAELRAHIRNNQGITFPLESGGALVLINKEDCENVDMAVTHELVHAMMEEKPGKYGEKENRIRGGFEGEGLNEVTVQLITLCSLQPERKVEAILTDINKGKLKTPYRKQINELGVLLWGTTLNKDINLHVSFDQVAKMYFDEENPPGDKRWLLKMSIVRGLPEEASGIKDFRKNGEKIFDAL